MQKKLTKKLALHKETLKTLDLVGVVGGKLAPVTFTCDTYLQCSYTCTNSQIQSCYSLSCYTTTAG